jgi:hypothetical protein
MALPSGSDLHVVALTKGFVGSPEPAAQIQRVDQ